MKSLGKIITFLIIVFSCGGLENLPDTVLINGKVWTGDENQPWAEWVTIENGRILEVGSGQPPLAAKVIDLNGQLTLPGFNDSHIHLASAGHLLLNSNLLDVNTTSGFIKQLKLTAERLPAGSWITRGDWGAYEAWSMGSEGLSRNNQYFTPHRAMIDSVTGNHPVLVTRYDRSQGLANQLALSILGIESESGLLTGRELKEAQALIPDKPYAQRLAETKRALAEIRKFGVTTVQDMSALDQMDYYQYLRDRDSLTARINFSPSRLIDYKMMIDKGWVIDWHNPAGPLPAGDEWFVFGTIKTHIDGIMGGRTARFFEPYSDNSMEMVEWRGGWREFSKDLDLFKSMIISADSAGIQLRIHAIGDEANSILLDILDTLDVANGAKDRRFRLVHAQVISDSDMPRFSGRNIIAEVQPYHVTDDMRWMEERIGYERCKGAYAFKSLNEAGSILSFGSDWPGTNASYYPINPLYGIYAAVTRQTLQGEPENGWFPEQKITLEDALRAYTYGSSFSAFEESRKGTIEPGKFADITVLDTDLFVTKPEKWLYANVVYTIVDGKIVYQQRSLVD